MKLMNSVQLIINSKIKTKRVAFMETNKYFNLFKLKNVNITSNKKLFISKMCIANKIENMEETETEDCIIPGEPCAKVLVNKK